MFSKLATKKDLQDLRTAINSIEDAITFTRSDIFRFKERPEKYVYTVIDIDGAVHIINNAGYHSYSHLDGMLEISNTDDVCIASFIGWKSFTKHPQEDK